MLMRLSKRWLSHIGVIRLTMDCRFRTFVIAHKVVAWIGGPGFDELVGPADGVNVNYANAVDSG